MDYLCPCEVLPSWEKVPHSVHDVATHGHQNGPLAAQVVDDQGSEEHGGQDDGGKLNAG